MSQDKGVARQILRQMKMGKFEEREERIEGLLVLRGHHTIKNEDESWSKAIAKSSFPSKCFSFH